MNPSAFFVFLKINNILKVSDSATGFEIVFRCQKITLVDARSYFVARGTQFLTLLETKMIFVVAGVFQWMRESFSRSLAQKNSLLASTSSSSHTAFKDHPKKTEKLKSFVLLLYNLFNTIYFNGGVE